MMKKLFYLTLIVSTTLAACLKPPEYPIEPEIEFIELIGDTLSSSTSNPDSISFKFSFTDGDGDIGYTKDQLAANIDTNCVDVCDSLCYNHAFTSVIVIDSRTKCSVEFNLPFIPEKGSSGDISGIITIDVHQAFCFTETKELKFSGIDSVQLFIKIKDRAGNLSNEIMTPYIYLSCEP